MRWSAAISPAMTWSTSECVWLTAVFTRSIPTSERFIIAGSLAFQDAVKKAKPVLLEPIMRIEVVTPEDYMGAVNGDLNRRRGQIEKMEPRPGGAQVITAFVPLVGNVWLYD